MKIVDFNINEINKIANTDTVFALGKFHTLHLGHIEVIKRAKELSKASKNLAVMIFDEKNSVICEKTRLKKLESLGVDIVLRFEKNEENYKVSQQEFIDYLINVFSTTDLVVGENFSFGKGNDDDFEIIRRSLNLEVVNLLELEGDVVSTSRIVDLINNGNVEQANRLLGFNYSYTGEVERGEGRGGWEGGQRIS